jgi:UrcA family protein
MRHEHFWVMCAAASTALVIIVGAAGAAVAQPPAREATVIGQRPDDGLSVRVSYRDLNLASLQGEKTLNRRVGRAADTVCEPQFDNIALSYCVSYAWRGARPQIALAVKRAHEMASTGYSSIPLVAIAISVR